MLNRIAGVIAILWGGSAIYRWFTTPEFGNAAYQTGWNIGNLFGVVLLLAGLHALFRKSN